MVGEEDTEEVHLMVVVGMAEEIAMAMVDPAGGEKNPLQDSTQPSSFAASLYAVLQAPYYRSDLT